MFSNSYQSGLHIELFNTQNKELVKNWKLSGKIIKEYDSAIKGYINILNANGMSKMQIPNNDKNTLGIVQSYIVLQIYLFSPKSLSIEIAISDTSKTKRRLMFSTSSKDIVVNTLHCRIPLNNIPVGVWLNLSIDVLSFVSECFKSQTFRSIDYISISANCKIRRIFSMRNSLVEWGKTNNDEFPIEYGEVLPKNLALPNSLQHENINLNIERIRGSFSEEGVIGTYSEGTNANGQGDKRNIRENELVQMSGPVPGTYAGGKKANQLNQINRNSTSPQRKINEIRSKSQRRIKNPKSSVPNDGQREIENKQEFIKNEIRFLSKSPDCQSDEENSNDCDTNQPNIYNKYRSNQLMKIEAMKNNFKNIVNNKNNMFNMKKYTKPTKEVTSPKNYQLKNNKNNKNSIGVNNSKIPLNQFNNLNLYNDGKESKMLLNTLNYKNIEKWEISKDNMADSIEEIFEIEDKNNLNNWGSDSNKNTEERPVKDKIDESEDKFYYDIPIKDNKKKSHSNYKDSANFFNSNTKYMKNKESSSVLGENLNTLDTKRHIIEEILKESENTLTMKDRERPFTPPFTTLVRKSNLQSIDRTDVILEREKEEILSSDIYEKIINMDRNDSISIRGDLKQNKFSEIKDEILLSKSIQLIEGDIRNQDVDLIYDHVLGCYYDPKTNMYYELKNN